LALRPTDPKTPADPRADRDAAQNEVFLREVDDALRQDQMFGIFRNYGKPIAAAVVAGLLALAGWLWWDNSRNTATGERGEQITQALDRIEAGHFDTADKALAAVAAESGGAAATAKLGRAGIALQQNKREQAVRLYAEVAEDADAPKPFRDLATVRQVALGFDSMPPQVVIDRLKPLAVPGNPWFGSTGELVGIAYLKQNRADLAGPLFASIARDKDAPESLKRRARQMAGVLGVDAIDDVAKAAAGDGAEAGPDLGPEAAGVTGNAPAQP
jgi:hypothetical protein